MQGELDHVHDVEKEARAQDDLANTTVFSLAWDGLNLEIIQRKTSISILTDVSGVAMAGELVAIMGPSGSGKTSLLDALAGRRGNIKHGVFTGDICINNRPVTPRQIQSVSSFVEQEDTFIGALTARETLEIAAKLSLPRTVSVGERKRRVEELLQAFGLRNQANVLVGTPIRKGLSGGQKRRLSIASQLITAPKILFLDEPTSGLDSVASYEVIKYLKVVAKRHKVIVVASIHQPSTSTFNLFDKLLLLSRGMPAYHGQISHIEEYLEKQGLRLPAHTNPAEYLLDVVNIDFQQTDHGTENLKHIFEFWRASPEATELSKSLSRSGSESSSTSLNDSGSRAPFDSIVLALLHRSFIKSYRDVVAYGIRFAMYMGLAIMMGTVWLRLPTVQSSIQPFINAIFFGGAFISFMAVAYVPAFLEDRSTLIKERANGLYGATPFVIANVLIGLPYLFLIAVLFSIPSYWLVNFQPTASAFFTYVLWLFLDLLAAESLVVLLSSIFPNFVVALALTAFANGLWMSVGGFLVSPEVLNVFWRYVFHYIDYQAYVFRAMMSNEFAKRTYDCGPGCQCMYDSALASECKIDGRAVLREYGYRASGNGGKWVGIMLAIIVVYRLLGWVALTVKKR